MSNNNNNDVIKFSKGNRKLPKDTAIWNLPHRITCPGATKECLTYCYAKKAESGLYPQVLPFRYNNLRLSKRENFAELVINKLKRMRVLNAVRIHESGDFYNQKYLDKWTQVAKAMPHIQFTFYTKSFHLFDFSEIRKLKNVTAFASIDPTTPKVRLKKAEGWAHATVIAKHTQEPEGFFKCPGSCKKCPHCYQPDAKSVAFEQH